MHSNAGHMFFFCVDLLSSCLHELHCMTRCGMPHIIVFCGDLQTFNELFKCHMTEAEVLTMVSKSEEFEQIKVLTKIFCILHLNLI